MPPNRVPRPHWHFRAVGHDPRVAGSHSAETLQLRPQGHGPENDGDDASRCLAESRRRHHQPGRNSESLLRRHARMNAFRYQAIEGNGAAVDGIIEAEDRKTALQLLGQRGLFPSSLESAAAALETPAPVRPVEETKPSPSRFGGRIKRKDITAFTREMGALLEA